MLGIRILFFQCGLVSLCMLYFLMYHKVGYVWRAYRTVVPARRPLILYWTTHWGEPYPAAQVETKMQTYCKNWKCEVTADHGLFRNSSAVIFIAPDFKLENAPKRYKSSQIYVYESLEPPSVLSRLKKGKTLNQLKRANDLFNWTFTFHGNSDVYHDIFGTLIYLNDSARFKPEYQRLRYPWVQRKSDMNINWNLQPLLRSTHAELRKKIQKKTKMAAIAASNCNTQSKREDYVKELRKYIEVDRFGYRGNCHDKHCNPKCYDLWDKDYFFYLSFENSFARDYVSEKPYKILSADTIPVVRGGANYTSRLPPKSYINVQDFKGPKELAEFLKLLSANATEYASYFEWKKDFAMVLPQFGNLCNLCEKLTAPIQYKTYHDIYKFMTE